MTATTPTRRRKTNHNPVRRLRLPRLGWGWAIVALAAASVARTWPVLTTITVTLLTTATVIALIRPRRLAPLLDNLGHIRLHRAALPARGARTLDAFHRLTPARFEQAIADLANEDPHVTQATVLGGANDRGMDVLVHTRDGRRILIQCKHHQTGNNVGSDVVQTVNGVYRDIHHCHHAVIVTTAHFTPAAQDTNRMLPTPIRLIDGNALTHWANGGLPPWA